MQGGYAMKGFVLFVSIALGGCARTAHSGLVVVDFDAEYHTAIIPTLTGGQLAMPYLEAGLKYWAPVGVTFATPEYLGAGDPEIDAALKTYPHVRVRWALDDTNPFEPGLAGRYDYSTGEISLYMRYWIENKHTLPYEGTALSTMIAHELGHAMGLEHVIDAKAVMQSQNQYLDCIGAADVAEFERVTH